MLLKHIEVDIEIIPGKAGFTWPMSLHQATQLGQPRRTWKRAAVGAGWEEGEYVTEAPTSTPERVAELRGQVLGGLRAKMRERYSEPNSRTPNLDRECDTGYHSKTHHVGWDGSKCNNCGWEEH
jgi:hypothetical protein